MDTLMTDDRLSAAQQAAEMMGRLDPGGCHLAGDDPAVLLSSVETSKPDIVWLDAEMQGVNAIDLAAKIREISPDTDIVFVTDRPDYKGETGDVLVNGFMLKPIGGGKILDEIKKMKRPASAEKGVRVQCFGNFEVFVNGSIMKFTRSLSKEALAYLVDRRGAGCTVGEICSILWEDRQADKKLKSQCRVVMAALKKDMAALGIEDILVKNWNTWSIDPSGITCDYYDYLKGDSIAVNSFHGEYMAQYSWAEMTAGKLFDITEAERDA